MTTNLPSGGLHKWRITQLSQDSVFVFQPGAGGGRRLSDRHQLDDGKLGLE